MEVHHFEKHSPELHILRIRQSHICLAFMSILEDLPAVDEDVGARVEDKGEVRDGRKKNRPGHSFYFFKNIRRCCLKFVMIRSYEVDF